MKKALQTALARWLAHREARTTRRLARKLRDHTRRAHAEIARHHARARGLRLYAAWVSPRVRPAKPGDILEARRPQVLEQALREDAPVPIDIRARLRRVLGSIPRPTRIAA